MHTCDSDVNVTCKTIILSCVDQDWNEVVPETVRLDTSAHKAKGLLAQKAKRQPPSRTKLKENLAVTSSPSKVGQELSDQRFYSKPQYNSVLTWKKHQPDLNLKVNQQM